MYNQSADLNDHYSCRLYIHLKAQKVYIEHSEDAVNAEFISASQLGYISCSYNGQVHGELWLLFATGYLFLCLFVPIMDYLGVPNITELVCFNKVASLSLLVFVVNI